MSSAAGVASASLPSTSVAPRGMAATSDSVYSRLLATVRVVRQARLSKVEGQLRMRPRDHDLPGEQAAVLSGASSRRDCGAHVADLAGEREEALAAQAIGDAQLEQIDRRRLQRHVR